VNSFIDFGATPDCIDYSRKNDETAILLAILFSKKKEIKSLVAQKVDLTCRSIANSVMEKSIFWQRSRNMEIIDFLYEQGANIQRIFWLAFKGDFCSLLPMLEANPD